MIVGYALYRFLDVRYTSNLIMSNNDLNKEPRLIPFYISSGRFKFPIRRKQGTIWLLHMLYCMNWLTYQFGLELEGGSLITHMALGHPLHPINSRSRKKRRDMWVGRRVPPWWPLFPPRNSVFIYIYIYVCILYAGSGYRTYMCTYTGSVV